MNVFVFMYKTMLYCTVLHRSIRKGFLCCVSLKPTRKYKYFCNKNITVNKVFMYTTMLYFTVLHRSTSKGFLCCVKRLQV